MTDTHTRRVQQQFGATAAAYVTSAEPRRRRGPGPARRVGTERRRPAACSISRPAAGHTALAFAGFARQLTALDLTEPMLQAARDLLHRAGLANATFVAGDVAALPFADGCLRRGDLSPGRPPLRGPGARRCARSSACCAPGGSFLVEDILGHDDAELAAFITEVERRRDPSHVRAYRTVEWKAMLRGAGLTVMDSAVLSKSRPWDDWTRRMRMTDEARQALESFVRAAPARCRRPSPFRSATGSSRSPIACSCFAPSAIKLGRRMAPNPSARGAPRPSRGAPRYS